MAAVIVSRIVAIGRVLTALQTRTFDEGEEFKTVSKKQRCALEALMVATPTITASEAASIAEALATVPFTEIDATVLMGLVSEALFIDQYRHDAFADWSQTATELPQLHEFYGQVALGSNLCTSLPDDATHPAVPSR